MKAVLGVAEREHLDRVDRLLSERQGQNLAVTVLHTPYSLVNGLSLASRGALRHTRQSPRNLDGMVISLHFRTACLTGSARPLGSKRARVPRKRWQQSSTLEATQGQIDGFFSQFPYKYHQNRVASMRY